MPFLAELARQSSADAWPFVPGAILRDAPRGLAPGRSRTIMAAAAVVARFHAGIHDWAGLSVHAARVEPAPTRG